MLGKIFRGLSFFIVILSALNVGIEGIFHTDLASAIIGSAGTTVRIIQIIVGIAGVISLINFVGCCSAKHKKCCSKSCHTSHCDK